MMMRHVTIGLVILMLFTVGCTMTQQDCEPPAKKMTDVNGNSVCVLGNFSDMGNATGPSNGTDERPDNMTAKEYLKELRDEAGIEENASDKPDVNESAVNETTANETTEEEQEKTDEETGEETEKQEPETEEESQTQDGIAAARDAAAALSESERAKLPSRTVTEGETVSFSDLEATDPDGDTLEYYFDSPLNENGKWQTEEGDAGEYLFTVTVSDGVNNVSRDVLVTVEKENRAPVIGEVEDITVTAGDLVSYPVQVTDPDEDNVTVTFSEPLSDEGEWQTESGDVGTYEIDITATDGELSVSKSFILEVVESNEPPVIEDLPASLTVQEGETIFLEPTVTDPDGDNVTVSYHGWMNSSTYNTTYEDAGNYTVDVSAYDGEDSTVKTVEITVEDVNRPPQFDEDAFE